MGGRRTIKKNKKTILSHTVFATLAIRSWKEFIFEGYLYRRERRGGRVGMQKLRRVVQKVRPAPHICVSSCHRCHCPDIHDPDDFLQRRRGVRLFFFFALNSNPNPREKERERERARLLKRARKAHTHHNAP